METASGQSLEKQRAWRKWRWLSPDSVVLDITYDMRILILQQVTACVPGQGMLTSVSYKCLDLFSNCSMIRIGIWMYIDSRWLGDGSDHYLVYIYNKHNFTLLLALNCHVVECENII